MSISCEKRAGGRDQCKPVVPQPLCSFSSGAAATRIKPYGRGWGEGTKQQVPRATRAGTSSLYSIFLHLLSSLLTFSTPLILPLSLRREDPAGEERRRPDTLQLWQERERRQQQQQQSGVWGAPRKDRYGHGAIASWKALEMSGNEPS